MFWQNNKRFRLYSIFLVIWGILYPFYLTAMELEGSDLSRGEKEENNLKEGESSKKVTVSKDSYLPSQAQLSPQTKKQLSNSKTQENTPQKFLFNKENLEREAFPSQKNLFQTFNHEIGNSPLQSRNEETFQLQANDYSKLLPTPTQINVFVNRSILGRINQDSIAYLNLAPDDFNHCPEYFSKYEIIKEELFKNLSYALQLLGDLLPKESLEDRVLSYYQSYRFNPENEELWNFFIRMGISQPTPESIKGVLRN